MQWFILLWQLSTLILTLFSISPTQAGEPSRADSIPFFWHDPIVVLGTRLRLGEQEFVLDKSNQTDILRHIGFDLINKGTAFTSDLYREGFKRDDIVVRIDGERYPCACPNRMDTAISRINPLELASCRADHSSCGVAAGIGGSVEFKREVPAQETRIRGVVSGSRGGGQTCDTALAADHSGYRITGRYATGEPYEDASGRDFATLYGYEQNSDFRLLELSVFGGRSRWRQGMTYSQTRDLLFPYLRMDERETRFWAAHINRDDHTLYLNHTNHRMDNALRVSNLTMVSDATNTTVGLAGPSYELYYRHWDIQNFLESPTARVDNHLIGDLHLMSARYEKRLRFPSGVELAGRIGLQNQRLGDSTRLEFHRVLYDEAKSSRWFLPFSGLASYARPLGKTITGGLLLELASEPPHPRELYIAVQKLGAKPWWSGNPGLQAPIRGSVRGRLMRGPVRLDWQASRIWNGVALLATRADDRAYLSYTNQDLQLVGGSLTLDSRFLTISASYTHGRNLSRDVPLAEIQPLTVQASMRTPRWRHLDGWFRVTYADTQPRVDSALNEKPTPSWTRFDAGLNLQSSGWCLNLEVENLGNELYSEHLSFLRDPFAASVRVQAPGRTVRLVFLVGV